MIDEDVLRDLLARSADEYDPPPSGPGAVLAAAEAGAPAPRTRPPRRRVLAVAAAVLLVVAATGGLLASRDDDASLMSAGGDDAGAPAADGDGFASGGGAGGGGASGGGEAVGQPVPSAASRVVKTGAVVLEVPEGGFERAVDRLSSLATGTGGFVAETRTFDSEDVPSGSVTLRVPAADFEQVLSEIRKLGEVQSVTSAAKDVTAQYTDIEARLRALTGTRDQLLTLLGRAGTIPDVLAVQDRLNAVQSEIEQLQGQQKVLDDQTSFGRLEVSVSEPDGDLAGTGERSGLAEAWDDARDGFTGGIEWIIARSGTTLVVLLSALVLLALGRAMWPALRRRLV